VTAGCGRQEGEGAVSIVTLAAWWAEWLADDETRMLRLVLMKPIFAL
jgi:hypothetical protein